MILDQVILHSDQMTRQGRIQELLPRRIFSAKSGQGMESLKQLLSQDKVAALMGSSGVGKSSLINALIGEEKLRTSDTSHYKDKGRHTTTHRELIPLGAGAYLIDTPGMRELKLDESDADAAFDEIISLGSACRFRNCTHLKEPGCAVRDALAIGLIDADRFKSYLKLRREEQRPRRKPR